METPNYYNDKNKRQLLSPAKQSQKVKLNENPHGKIKETVKDVGSDLVIGVLGGGLLAATLGRYAFIAGLGISGYGHYCKNQKLSALGLGLMASGTLTAVNGKPIDSKLSTTDQIAERIKAFGDELKKKLFLDKFLPEKADESVSGIETSSSNEPALKIVKDTRPSETAFKEKEVLEQKNQPETKKQEVENEAPLPFINEDDWTDSNRIY